MYELHCVRPDLILLRVTARNLIMWDSVHPTEQWLDSQVCDCYVIAMRLLCDYYVIAT